MYQLVSTLIRGQVIDDHSDDRVPRNRLAKAKATLSQYEVPYQCVLSERSLLIMKHLLFTPPQDGHMMKSVAVNILQH